MSKPTCGNVSVSGTLPLLGIMAIYLVWWLIWGDDAGDFPIMLLVG